MWLPTARPVSSAGEPHALKAAPSRLHWNDAPATSEAKLAVAAPPDTTRSVIDVSGAGATGGSP